ncbi:MoaB/Mog domain-containing protein [Salix suchowensis]|nr:MoaB/Mog domain-containing protein [Salix suchowensis]
MVRNYDFVITSGGIGPTHDDITYASLAKAFDQPLAHHPECLRRMDEMIRHRPWVAIQNEEQREATRPCCTVGGETVYLSRNTGSVPEDDKRVDTFPPLPPLSEKPLRMQIFTSRPESLIAPYLTALQARMKAYGIQVGSYPVLAQGVYVSLIGRDRDKVQDVAKEVETEVVGKIVTEEELRDANNWRGVELRRCYLAQWTCEIALLNWGDTSSITIMSPMGFRCCKYWQNSSFEAHFRVPSRPSTAITNTIDLWDEPETVDIGKVLTMTHDEIFRVVEGSVQYTLGEPGASSRLVAAACQTRFYTAEDGEISFQEAPYTPSSWRLERKSLWKRRQHQWLVELFHDGCVEITYGFQDEGKEVFFRNSLLLVEAQQSFAVMQVFYHGDGYPVLLPGIRFLEKGIDAIRWAYLAKSEIEARLYQSIHSDHASWDLPTHLNYKGEIKYSKMWVCSSYVTIATPMATSDVVDLWDEPETINLAKVIAMVCRHFCPLINSAMINEDGFQRPPKLGPSHQGSNVRRT